jgi:hypothetical protein
MSTLTVKIVLANAIDVTVSADTLSVNLKVKLSIGWKWMNDNILYSASFNVIPPISICSES